jgi:hypothetical protein
MVSTEIDENYEFLAKWIHKAERLICVDIRFALLAVYSVCDHLASFSGKLTGSVDIFVSDKSCALSGSGRSLLSYFLPFESNYM